ncbi:MAG: A24 family peptidase [Tepidisphaeraceae bacterium]
MGMYHLLQVAPLLALLALGAAIDLKCRRIPNWLTGTIALGGLLQTTWSGSTLTFGQALLGMLVGFALPFVLYAIGALGGGDVKLLSGLGSWVGAAAVVKVFLIAAVVGMIIVLAQALWQRRLTNLFRNSAVLTMSLANLDAVGTKTLAETGQSCRSVDRPLPYAVPVLLSVVLLMAATWR